MVAINLLLNIINIQKGHKNALQLLLPLIIGLRPDHPRQPHHLARNNLAHQILPQLTNNLPWDSTLRINLLHFDSLVENGLD